MSDEKEPVMKQKSSSFKAIRDEIQKMASKDFGTLAKDYDIICHQLNNSFWSRQTVAIAQNAQRTVVNTKKKNFGKIIALKINSSLQDLNVPKKNRQKIKELVEGMTEIVELQDGDADMDLNERFYVDVDYSLHGISYVGYLVFGFMPAENRPKHYIEFVTCGHCEEWHSTWFAKLDQTVKDHNQIKNYLVYQLLLKIGGNDIDKLEEKRKNGGYVKYRNNNIQRSIKDGKKKTSKKKSKKKSSSKSNNNNDIDSDIYNDKDDSKNNDSSKSGFCPFM